MLLENQNAEHGRTRSILAILLIALLTAIVLKQAIPLYTEPDRDNGIYLYLGKQIIEGKLPYVDAWEQKPPVIFYINAAGLALGNGSRWGVFFLEFVAVFSAGWFFYWLANTLWGFETAVLSSAVWLLSLDRILQGGNLTEEYSLPFNFLSLTLFWLAEQKKKTFYYFWIGMCFALSFFLRPNNVGTQAAIVLSLLIGWWMQRKAPVPLRKIAWLVAGALIPTLVILLYFLWQGILLPMIEVGFLYNFSYGSKFDILGSLVAGTARLAPIWWLAFLGYFAWVLQLRERYLRDHSMPSLPDIAPLLMLPLEILLSGLSGRNYAHYFICWLPAMALFSAFAIHKAIQSAAPGESRRFVVLFIVITSFLLITNPKTIPAYQGAFERLIFDRSNGVDRISPLVDYIRENTHPADTVLVWTSRPGINFMANRDVPTAYFGYPTYVNPKFVSKYQSIFLQDIMTNPPDLIIDSTFLESDYVPSLDPATRKDQLRKDKGLLFYPDGLDGFFQFFEAHYQFETEIDEYIIYRRVD